MRGFFIKKTFFISLILLLLDSICLFSKPGLNLNTVSEEELLAFPYIDSAKSTEIINYRRRAGSFKDISELRYIFRPEVVARLCEVCDVYAVSEDVWKSRITKDYSSLKDSKMLMRRYPVEGYSAIIVFPDGGVMLVNCGDETGEKELSYYLNNELIKNKESGIMKLLGWKPRIDWLVINNFSERTMGGFGAVMKNFSINELITAVIAGSSGENGEYLGEMEDYYTMDSKINEIKESNKIDALQTVSPVEVNVYNAGLYEGNNSDMILKVKFNDFNGVFLPETVSQKVIEKYCFENFLIIFRLILVPRAGLEPARAF